MVLICQGCRFDPRSGHIWESTNECAISGTTKTAVSLSFSFSSIKNDYFKNQIDEKLLQTHRGLRIITGNKTGGLNLSIHKIQSFKLKSMSKDPVLFYCSGISIVQQILTSCSHSHLHGNGYWWRYTNYLINLSAHLPWLFYWLCYVLGQWDTCRHEVNSDCQHICIFELVVVVFPYSTSKRRTWPGWLTRMEKTDRYIEMTRTESLLSNILWLP